MTSAARPNVVLFLTDQWRAKDTGYWGNPVIQTPHTDRLARAGAGFRWCFVQNPVSTPSRDPRSWKTTSASVEASSTHSSR